MSGYKHNREYAQELRKTGLTVRVENNNIESAIKVLKRKVLTEGLLDDLRKHEYYVKPTIQKRLDRKNAVLRERARQKKVRLENGF
jgi:small subunit ribosomal protein S21